jgi:hypothetical protein
MNKTFLLLKNSNLFGVGYLLYLVLVPFQMFEKASPIKDSMLFSYAIMLGEVLCAIF